MFAIGNTGELGFGSTVSIVIEIAVLQYLTKLPGHGDTLGNGLGTYHMTGEILTEIQHGFSGRSMDDFLYRECFHIVQERGIPLAQLTGGIDGNACFHAPRGWE